MLRPSLPMHEGGPERCIKSAHCSSSGSLPPELARARLWYERAAVQGNEKRPAGLRPLWQGEGVVKNAKLSAAWNAFADSLEGKLAGSVPLRETLRFAIRVEGPLYPENRWHS